MDPVNYGQYGTGYGTTNTESEAKPSETQFLENTQTVAETPVNENAGQNFVKRALSLINKSEEDSIQEAVVDFVKDSILDAKLAIAEADNKIDKTTIQLAKAGLKVQQATLAQEEGKYEIRKSFEDYVSNRVELANAITLAENAVNEIQYELSRFEEERDFLKTILNDLEG